MSRPLKSVDVRRYGTVKEVLKAVDKELKELAAIAKDTDFNEPIHSAQFSRNVVYVKAYYEHCERLIRGN
jgi:hypothetical protein